MATTLTDAEFIDKFIELGKSQTRMAEHCGNSRQAIAKRLKRLHALACDTSEEEKSSGKTAVIVHAEMAHHVTKNFDDGVQSTINEMKSLTKRHTPPHRGELRIHHRGAEGDQRRHRQA